MSGLSTHVLDTALGRPARGVRVQLAVLEPTGSWTTLCDRVTDEDGRARDLLSGAALEARTYRLKFETGPYLLATHRAAFYPRVEVVFAVERAGEHHHVPLLLSPFGYSTYRGS
jgi:5-hydroxyisourate hydrolase